MSGRLFVIATVTNIVYLAYFYSLMYTLEKYAVTFWQDIGRPNSFSASHVNSVLNNLYKRRMKEALESSGMLHRLYLVRSLLPIAIAINVCMLIVLSKNYRS